MSMFARIWNFIRRPTGFVGKDLEGNYFYERASTTDDPRRTRRVVKYKGKTDVLEVANRSRQLSVQWKAWLTHTRPHPPSLEELQADVVRRERLKHNVTLIEARDREERLRLASANSIQRVFAEPSKQQLDAPDAQPGPSDVHSPRNETEHTDLGTSESGRQSPWSPKPSSDEPQSWTPRAVSRGG